MNLARLAAKTRANNKTSRGFKQGLLLRVPFKTVSLLSENTPGNTVTDKPVAIRI